MRRPKDTRMRIVFVKPSWRYPITRAENTYNRRWPPLDLLNCAAVAESAGHEVDLVDAHAEGLPPREAARRTGAADMVVLTSSALDRWQCPNLEVGPVAAAARHLRRCTDFLVLTGFHGTVEPAAMLELTGADAVIRGEPEETIRDLAAGTPPEETPGLTLRRGGELLSTPGRAPVDLARLPVPAFHLVDPRRYRYEVLGGRFMVLEGSRGCPYPCTFCSRVMQGKVLRRKTVEQLGREVELAVTRYGVRSAYFIDLEFTASPGLVDGLCRFILGRRLRLRWCCQTRADLVSEPLLRLMKRAGCRLVHFGVEAGSERIVRLMRKRTTLEAQRAGVELARRVGLETLCFFLVGYPGETEAEMRRTLDLAKSLNPTYAAFHRVTPYQGSALADEFRGRAPGDDLFPPYAGPPDERLRVDRFVRRALWDYYVRPRYMLGRLVRSGPASLWRQVRLFVGYFR